MIIPILRKQRCRVSQNSIEMALAGGGLQVIMREKRVRGLSWSLAGFFGQSGFQSQGRKELFAVFFLPPACLELRTSGCGNKTYFHR